MHFKSKTTQLKRLKYMENHKRTYFSPLGVPVKSSLNTPIIRIEDHNSGILSCDFHPSGNYLLSSNRNGQIRICDMYGSFSKTTVLEGHRGSVMDACFSRDGSNIYSAAIDRSLGIWDALIGSRKTKLQGHTGGINCVQGARTAYDFLCSGSNDSTVRIWDSRQERCVKTLENGAEVNAACFSQYGEYIIAGGLNKDMKIWDLRTYEIVRELRGHKGKVTGIALSPCGMYLLSHSADNSLRIWDMRPSSTSGACVNSFSSYQHCSDGLLRCAWSADSKMISAGTSDYDLYVWDAVEGNILHELPGHERSINDVAFHPKESVILSASNDNYLFLHEMDNLKK